MKRIVCLVVMVVGMVSLVYAQKDEKALKFLDAMSTKYKKYDSFSADFQYTMENKEESINESYIGKVIIKGQKYRLSVAGQQIFNDGEVMWTYLPAESEVSITDSEEGDLRPNEIYSAYKNGYNYKFIEMNGNSGVIDLIPEDKDSQFETVTLEIDKSDYSLKRWKLKDVSGSSYIYTINNFKENVGVEDTYFVFDPGKHPGVEVIDYR